MGKYKKLFEDLLQEVRNPKSKNKIAYRKRKQEEKDANEQLKEFKNESHESGNLSDV